MARKKTNPIIPALLSFLVMGTGQIYNKQTHKGIALLLCDIVLTATFFVSESIMGTVESLTFLLIIAVPWTILWLWNIYDAYINAK